MYVISVSTVKTSCVKHAKMVSIVCDNKAIPKLFNYLMTQYPPQSQKQILCGYKTIQTVQKRQNIENKGNKDKWDKKREKGQRMKQAMRSLFRPIPQCIPTSRQEVFNY